MKQTINVKPLSVNRCFQGRRFRTKAYDNYDMLLTSMLNKFDLPAAPYHLRLDFGFSNSLIDVDNCVKPTMDILAKKYNFNDRDVHKITAQKVKVKKGDEFITFEIETV